MAIASVVTDGYSISGGYQGGVTTLVRFGYSFTTVVVAGFVCIRGGILAAPRATGSITVAYATGYLEC